MILTNASSAFLDIRKLTDYILNPQHPIGRHKAKVFRSALNITASDAAWLGATILSEILSADAIEAGSDRFGVRFRVDLTIRRQDREVVVRTIWIQERPDDGRAS